MMLQAFGLQANLTVILNKISLDTTYSVFFTNKKADRQTKI